MKTLVKKVENPSLLKVEFVVGGIIMAAAMIGLPLLFILLEVNLFVETTALVVVLVGELFFGLVGYFRSVRPYLLHRKLPVVQAETDGEFLYIHSKKEAKIPLSELTEATVYVELPYMLQKEFVSDFVLHLCTEKYGNLLLEIPGFGSYRMYFVSYVQDTSDSLIRFIDNAMNSAE